MKTNKQKQINCMLSSIKNTSEVYSTWGKVKRVYLSTVLYIIDFIIPSMRLISLFALVIQKINKDKHLFNITISNK